MPHSSSESVRISLCAAADRQILEEGLKRLRAIVDQPQAFYQAIV